MLDKLSAESLSDTILIFDLDGTILSINSFPVWAWYMLKGGSTSLTMSTRIKIAFRTACIMFKRKVCRRSHFATKQALQKLWIQSQANADTLNNALLKHIRPELAGLLQLVRSGQVKAILATSAAACYAVELGQKLGFTYITATHLGGLENRSEEKLDSVMRLIESNGWSDFKRILLTDHPEDLPLIKQCQQTIWFGDNAGLEVVRLETPGTNIEIWN